MAKKSTKTTEAIENVELQETPIVEEKKTAVIVNCASLNFRAKASTDSEVLRILDCGTALNVETIQKKWTKVTLDGVTGYVMNDFITLE